MGRSEVRMRNASAQEQNEPECDEDVADEPVKMGSRRKAREIQGIWISRRDRKTAGEQINIYNDFIFKIYFKTRTDSHTTYTFCTMKQKAIDNKLNIISDIKSDISSNYKLYDY